MNESTIDYVFKESSTEKRHYRKNVNEYKNKYQNLKKRYRQLKEHHQDLKNEYDELYNDYEESKDHHTQLKNNHKRLQDDHKRSQHEHESETKQFHDFISFAKCYFGASWEYMKDMYHAYLNHQNINNEIYLNNHETHTYIDLTQDEETANDDCILKTVNDDCILNIYD